MEEERQCDTELSRQRQSLPEVPQSFTTVLPTNLQTTTTSQQMREIFHTQQQLVTMNRSNMTAQMVIPCQILPQHLGSPSAAGWPL